MDPKPAAAAKTDADDLVGLRVHLVGRFASVPRREAVAAVERRGAEVTERQPDLVVQGEDATPAEVASATEAARQAGAMLLSESDLWRRLDLVDDGVGVRKLYSPGMLAETVGVQVAVVRRWQRRGLLTPACRVNRLAYFDFEEARVAQLLATALAQGSTLAAIERRVEQLVAAYPHRHRPLAELSLAVVDGEILVRDGVELTETTGQRRLSFDGQERRVAEAAEAEDPRVLTLEPPGEAAPGASLRDRAWGFVERGDLAGAIEAWRLVMLESPPTADDHCQLADWLFEEGQSEAARERYYTVLELDADHLEARVSLGCLLSEAGDLDLAVAAFRGALDLHADFADAHYHLSEALERLGDAAGADVHRRRFLQLAPEGPWAEQARTKLAPPEASRDGRPVAPDRLT